MPPNFQVVSGIDIQINSGKQQSPQSIRQWWISDIGGDFVTCRWISVLLKISCSLSDFISQEVALIRSEITDDNISFVKFKKLINKWKGHVNVQRWGFV
jgi:hypothetical protein